MYQTLEQQKITLVFKAPKIIYVEYHPSAAINEGNKNMKAFLFNDPVHPE